MKIYRHNQLCELPDGKINDFTTQEEAQSYLDGVLDKSVLAASRARDSARIEVAIRSGFEIL